MDARTFVLLFVLGVSCVAAQTTPAAGTEVAWWGKVKPWKPIYNKPSIWQPLVLNSVSPPLENVTGTETSVYWSKVTCPANRDSTTPVGDGAWTGIILTADTGAVGTTAASGTTPVPANQSNVLIVFKLDYSCCGYGKGTISVIGRKVEGDSPALYTIVGGTGDFSFVRGGILTVTTNTDGTYTYKFHFYYYKY